MVGYETPAHKGIDICNSFSVALIFHQNLSESCRLPFELEKSFLAPSRQVDQICTASLIDSVSCFEALSVTMSFSSVSYFFTSVSSFTDITVLTK